MDDAKTYVSANYMLLAAVLLVVIAGIYFLLSRPRRAVTPHDPSSGKVQNRPLSTTADIMSRSGPPEQPHQFGDVWYYADHTGQVGPFTLQDLTVKLASIPNAKDLFVWCEGMPQWQTVVAIPQLNERIKQPPPPPRIRPLRIKPPRDYSWIGSFLRGFIIFVAIVSLIVVIGKTNQPSNPEDIACSQDYTKCLNNGQMINNYSKMIDATVKCQTELSKSVKYGSPEWGWVPFGSFYKGEDYVKTGIVRIVDNEVKIQNVFGAKVNSVVECRYDFNKQSAAIVNVSAR